MGIDPTDLGATTAVARNLLQGLMFDDFLPIPDAESLPFYPLVLKLVVRERESERERGEREREREREK